MNIGVCTIIAKNYLPYARALMSSLERLHPELLRFVILADEVDGYFDPSQENFHLVSTSGLDLPSSQWFHFKYNILELSTAVKPYALRSLLRKHNLDGIIYLDPDIQLYNRINPVTQALEDSDILLTPHLLESIPDEGRPSELDIIRSGVYNLGFIALARRPSACSFLEWWCAKLENHCVVAPDKGLFVDQRWCDFVPGMFDNVNILRAPGLNVAYWNIHGRRVENRNGCLTVNGEPLYFFHFSGFDPGNPEEFSRHQDRFRLPEIGDASALALDYRDALLRHGYRQCKNWPYRYGKFANGVPIPDLIRPVLNVAPRLIDEVEDPFSDGGFRAVCDAWSQPVGDSGGPPFFTRLALWIYACRTDLREAFPAIYRADRAGYFSWLAQNAARDHNLPQDVTLPFQQGAEHCLRNAAASRSEQAAGDGHGDFREEDGRISDSVRGLVRFIHESRSDLKEVFPDPFGRDRLSYLTWVCTFGQVEHGLAPEWNPLIREEWKAAARDEPSSLRVWWQWIRRTAYGLSARFSTRASNRWHAPPVPVNGNHRPEVREAPAADAQRPLERNGSASAFGVNVAGYVNAEMGVGEAARSLIRSARRAGVPVAVKRVITGGGHRECDRRVAEDAEHNHPVNIFHVNADQMPVALETAGAGFHSGKYNIGYWAWELEEFPAAFASAFDFTDEIWTPSRFCQDSISRASPSPVVRIPHSVCLGCPPPRGRPYFGLPGSAFLFVTAFDMLSVFERKNPLAVVRAFVQAFGQDPSTHLVLKVSNSQWNPGAMRKLVNAAAGYPVTFIDRIMDREDVDALFQTADCIVSLHRSEGFGLTLAEAMYLGKPVIATAYSGNMDFTTVGNSFLVGYRLVPVPPGCDPYPTTARWADPLLDEAVSQMRLVRHSPERRTEVAREGQAHVRRELSDATVGAAIRQRLERLAAKARSDALLTGAQPR